MSDSVWPQRRQPTRLPRPWDSPGKHTGVGCHFLLQCMKVKSESEVTQWCPTLSDPMDCSLPGSSVHGIFQARVLESDVNVYWVSNDLEAQVKHRLREIQRNTTEPLSFRKLKGPKVLSTGYSLLTRLRNTIYYCVEIQTLFRKKGLHTKRLEPLVTERDKNKTRLTMMGGEGNGTLLQYSCLENSMDGGAW